MRHSENVTVRVEVKYFSISIYLHISQVNLHITEIRYNEIITCFEYTSQK